MVALSIVTLCGGVVAALEVGFAAPASAVSGTALINGDTVTGGTSVEQTLAQDLGLTVTVVSGSTWNSMSATDFAQYTVLIIGDPTCKALAGSVTANRATWTSAVMATAGGNTVVGNRVVWGSAPVLSRTAHPGADKGISDGIAFAAALAPATGHATGVYFDASCDGQPYGPSAANPALLDTLNMLSVGTARPWTENPRPACGGTISFIGTAPQFSDIATSDFANWQCSVHESFPNFETDFVPLAIGTDAASPATCGTDTTTGATTCGEAYFLAAGPGLTATDPEISVTPLTATNPVGTTHTITAKVVHVGGPPLSNQLVSFTVSGANAGASGTCVPVDCRADSTGKVTFTYTGTNAGKDTITVSIMCNPAIHTADGNQDLGRTSAHDDTTHDGTADDATAAADRTARGTSSKSSFGTARTCTSATTGSKPAPWSIGTSPNAEPPAHPGTSQPSGAERCSTSSRRHSDSHSRPARREPRTSDGSPTARQSATRPYDNRDVDLTVPGRGRNDRATPSLRRGVRTAT